MVWPSANRRVSPRGDDENKQTKLASDSKNNPTTGDRDDKPVESKSMPLTTTTTNREESSSINVAIANKSSASKTVTQTSKRNSSASKARVKRKASRARRHESEADARFLSRFASVNNNRQQMSALSLQKHALNATAKKQKDSFVTGGSIFGAKTERTRDAQLDDELHQSSLLRRWLVAALASSCLLSCIQTKGKRRSMHSSSQDLSSSSGVESSAKSTNTIATTDSDSDFDNSNSDAVRNAKRRKHHYIVDPAQPVFYRWLAVISIAVGYNIVFVIGRGIFWKMHNLNSVAWYFCDYCADLIYGLDMLVSARTGYLHQGILVRNYRKLAAHYLSSVAFKLDCISLLPTDLLYFFLPSRCVNQVVPCAIIVRLNRLFRFYRLSQFFDKTESVTNFPLFSRIIRLLLYILTIIHWNACLYFSVSYYIGFGTDQWVYSPSVSPFVPLNKQQRTSDELASNDSSPADSAATLSLPTVSIETATAHNQIVDDSLAHQYIYCFYWSTLILTTIGEVPMPAQNAEYLFVVIDFLIGLLIFATIVGNIGSMITNMNAARADFQSRMDSVKQWMKFRKVNKQLEDRIIKWFDYLWANRQTLDEDAVTSILPDRLKAETAIHVHLETLKRVVLFQDCEPGLLVQLVLKLKLQVFSPGDFICRVGDVGKEMYIVKRGELSVLAEDCKKRLVKLSDGSVFGELSILNIKNVKTGNRRTANVCSVGYSDLFVLSKTDLWNVLEDYPDAQTLLVERGRQILRKDNLLIEDDSAPEVENSAQALIGRESKQTQAFLQSLLESFNEQSAKSLRMQEQLCARYELLLARANAACEQQLEAPSQAATKHSHKCLRKLSEVDESVLDMQSKVQDG